MTERDRDPVADVLASTPPSAVSPEFLARVNARIDAEAGGGWLDLLDYRAWTIRLAPAAALLALLVALWPGAGPTRDAVPATSTAADQFRPGLETDWQQEVTGNALLEAALIGGSNGG